MAQPDLGWAVPLMRAGYAGRGLVYLAVAGFSLYALFRGGQAQGTETALAQLETTGWGTIVLFLIFLGMIAYSLWRLLDAWYDLDDHGSDGKAILARSGMVVSALVHLSLAFLAFTLLFWSGGSQGGSSLASWLGTVMNWPGGRWIVGLAGLAVMAAGAYYVVAKGWRGKYRRNLRANHFTLHWNWILKAGVMAHGAVIAIIGLLLLIAAWRHNPQAAGGTQEAFSWLTGQPYGQTLVIVICLGLLGFAFFCFVSVAYRIVRKANGGGFETLAAKLKSSPG